MATGGPGRPFVFLKMLCLHDIVLASARLAPPHAGDSLFYPMTARPTPTRGNPMKTTRIILALCGRGPAGPPGRLQYDDVASAPGVTGSRRLRRSRLQRPLRRADRPPTKRWPSATRLRRPCWPSRTRTRSTILWPTIPFVPPDGRAQPAPRAPRAPRSVPVHLRPPALGHAARPRGHHGVERPCDMTDWTGVAHGPRHARGQAAHPLRAPGRSRDLAAPRPADRGLRLPHLLRH